MKRHPRVWLAAIYHRPYTNGIGSSDPVRYIHAMRIFLCLLAIVVSACASLQRFRTPAAPAAPPQRAARPIPYPVFETRAFTRAVQAGTRTRTWGARS
jgi:hypothetical protein